MARNLQHSHQHNNAYGEISVEDNASATVVSNNSTDFSEKVQVTTFDTNGPSSRTTPDHTSDDITIVVSGVYLIACHASFSGSANDVVSLAVFRNNGGGQITKRATRKFGTGGDVGALAICGCAELVAGDTVELWLQNETDADNVTIEDASLNIQKIG